MIISVNPQQKRKKENEKCEKEVMEHCSSFPGPKEKENQAWYHTALMLKSSPLKCLLATTVKLV